MNLPLPGLGSVEDFTVERTNDERLVGSIYKGKVKNLEDGLKAAFVDIGYEKNAFKKLELLCSFSLGINRTFQ